MANPAVVRCALCNAPLPDSVAEGTGVCDNSNTCRTVRKRREKKKLRKAREREKGGNPARYYRRKYQNAIGQKLSLKFDIHHLDCNWENIELDNLVALPKQLHADLHGQGNTIVWVKDRFYCPIQCRRLDTAVWSIRDKIVEEVMRWIEYRDYRLGKEPLNFTGFSYD